MAMSVSVGCLRELGAQRTRRFTRCIRLIKNGEMNQPVTDSRNRSVRARQLTGLRE